MLHLSSRSQALPNGSVDDFHGSIVQDQSAIGDAYSDIEGVDLGLGI